MASTAAGSRYGVAKEATIVAVQALDCKGNAHDSVFISAMDWAVADIKKARVPSVISISLGGKHAEILDDAARRVVDAGVTLVTAAGNLGANACQTSPGDSPKSITVGAVDQFDRWSSFSNWGPCVTLFAPGQDITAAYPRVGEDGQVRTDGAGTESGTSMATPHVAGAALQILQLHPTFSPADVRRALLCMATAGVIKGLGPSSPNRLLHAGNDLLLEKNAKLITFQHEKSQETSCRVPSDVHATHYGLSVGYVVPSNELVIQEVRGDGDDDQGEDNGDDDGDEEKDEDDDAKEEEEEEEEAKEQQTRKQRKQHHERTVRQSALQP